MVEYEGARQLAVNQPDADLAYGLVLIRQDKSPVALEVFDRVVKEHPNSLVAYQGAAWLRARRGDFKECIPCLEQLIRRLPANTDTLASTDLAYFDHATRFAGRLAAYMLTIAPEDRRVPRSDLAGLEKAIKERDSKAQATFADGARSIRAQAEQLENHIRDASLPNDKSLLEQKRTNFNHYLPFDYDDVRQYLLANLEK